MGFDNIPRYDVIPPIDIPISPIVYGSALLLFIVGIAVWQVLRRWRKGKTPLRNPRLLRYQRLVAVNLDDTKHAAYAISAIGYECADEALLEEYTALNRRLEPYKYAKNVKPFDQDTVESYRQFCEKVYEKIS